jgi:uncharacterized membrane protein
MKTILSIFLIILLSSTVFAATLEGSIYNSHLELEKDVLVEISTLPSQKYLSKDGTYSFDLSPGKYTLTATKGFNDITEIIEINVDSKFVIDLFLLPDLVEETELWKSTNEPLFSESEEETQEKTPWYSYLIGGIIVIYALSKFGKARMKYGNVKQFRKKVKEESLKTVENNPEYLDQVLEIIKKHGGRIKQKTLRRELLHLSEAKVSLIVSELEHKGKIEKFKKGRGNIILIK